MGHGRLAPSFPSRPRRRRAFGLRDLLVLLFVVALFPVAGAQLAQRSRETANRIKCSSNLRQIGLAIQIYANAQTTRRGSYPRTLFDTADAPVPTEYTGVNAPNPFGPGGPGPNDVTAGLFLLMRAGEITPGAFVCPASDASPFAGDPSATSNFADRSNLTYGYANPYPGAAARNVGFKMNFTLGSEFAVAADMGRGPDVGMVAANAPRPQMAKAYCPFPGGDGQNVLYGDGHVDWSPTIFCGSARPAPGAPRDNVYAYGVDASMTAPSAGVRGAPQDAYDSVILPTADMGPQPAPLPAPGAARRQFRTGLAVVGAVLVAALVVAAVIVFVVISRRPPQPPGRPPTGPPPLPPLPPPMRTA